MDTGDSSSTSTSQPEAQQERSPLSRTARLLIAGLVAALVLAVAAGWQVYRHLEETTGCPSEEWVVALSQEVEGLLPEGSTLGDSFTSDCDDRRAWEQTVNVSDPQAAAQAIRAAALAEGWAPDQRGVCVERDFQGLAATITVRTGRSDQLVVTAVRGECFTR